MYRPEEIAVVIPCLNEGRTIGSLVSEIRIYLRNVVVVDDGSSDNTAAEAERNGAMVIRHSLPHGKGASLRTGFEAALQNGFAWALAMDGDGQHAPTDIPYFLRAIESSPAAMFVGDRMPNARAMPFVRRVVNRWMSATIGAFCGAEIPDSQCGFRLLNLQAWNRIPFSCEHFEIESEMIVRFLHAGHGLGFVPVQTRYGSERSKIRPLRDTVRWLRWWIGIRNELSPYAHRRVVQPRYESTPQDATA